MNNISLITNTLYKMETSSSLGMFARDTGGCLISKLALSRSDDESREISFAELAESAIFYFSTAALLKPSSKILEKIFKLEKGEIFKPLSDFVSDNKDKIKNVKLAKIAQIGTVFSAILPAVFAIAPLRNILTKAETGKEKFVSVINLKKENKHKQRDEAKKKAVDFAAKMATISIAGIAATAGVVSSLKNKKIYKAFEPLINKSIKYLDFTKDKDLKLAHFALLIYPVSIWSYFFASRDKYETKENTRRFSITFPLMFLGEKMIEKPIHKFFSKVFNTKLLKDNNVLSYNDILKNSDNKTKELLKAKNYAYAATFFINTMAIAAAISILNRIATKEQYVRDQKNLADNAVKPVDINKMYYDFFKNKKQINSFL